MIADLLAFVAHAFGSQFAPASSAYNRDAVLLFLYTIMHTGAALGYGIMSAVLILRRDHIVNLTSAAFSLYGTFLALGCLHHAMQVVAQYAAVYRLDVLVLVAVCVQSCATAALTVLALFGTDDKS